mgnify:FL=1
MGNAGDFDRLRNLGGVIEDIDLDPLDEESLEEVDDLAEGVKDMELFDREFKLKDASKL